LTENGERSLSLDDVTRRFRDSEQALTQVRERLEALTSSADGARRSEVALEASAVAVQSLAAAAAELTGELERVLEQARATLQAAAEHLGGDEQQRFRRTVEERLDKLGTDIGRIYDSLPGRWRKGS